MKKELKLNGLVEYYNGREKYATQVENVYVYFAQLGWRYARSIMRSQVDNREQIYGEKSVVITFRGFINGDFCGGIESIKYTYGLDEEYRVDEIVNGLS